MRQLTTKATAIGLGVALLTLGACAANRATTSNGMAPSRQAAAKPLDDSQYYAPSESDSKPAQKTESKPAAKEPDLLPAAYISPTQPDTKPAVEHMPVEQVPGAKPLVPAFPAKMEQDKLRDVKTVFFLFDKSELTPDAKRLLADNARWMKAHPDVRVRVEGHCDERGTNEYNLALGSRRANQVRDYLVTLGISATMLEPVSYGEEMPLKAGHDESAWRLNRRVQFSPVDGPKPASAQLSDPSAPHM